MDQGTAECQFLLHATRKGPCPPPFEGLQLSVDVADKVVVLFDTRVEDGGKEVQVLLDRKVLVE